MNRKRLFRLAIVLVLPLLMLGSAHLALAKSPASGADHLASPTTVDTALDNSLDTQGERQNPLLITQQQAITHPTYGPATLLLEDQGGLVTELLPAYANWNFGSFYILREGDIYYLWLTSRYRNGSILESITQRFESQDGLIWRNRTNTNLAMSSTFWRWLGGPRHVIKDGPLYEAWESYFYEVVSGGWAVALRYITSPDGLTWTVVNQPALQTGSSPSLIKEGNTYYMWVGPDVDNAFDPDKRVRYRTSNNGGIWGHWKNDGVIISLDGNPLEWYPWPLPTRFRKTTDGTYQLFYLNGSGLNLATSANGITFTTQITDFVNFAEVLSISDTSNLTSGEFLVTDVQGEDWVYFMYSNGGGQHIAVTRPLSPPDLGLTKTASSATIAPGGTLTYSLTYSNTGQTTATGVVITDIVPISLTNVASQSSGAIITPAGGLDYSWLVQDLAEGQGGMITITGQISPSLTGSSHVTNTATITGAIAEPDATNNTATVGVTVNGPQLSLDKNVTPATKVAYHDTVTYTLILGNNGSGQAGKVLLTDTLPISATFARWLVQPSGANAANDQITWNGTISPNQAITFTFVATHTGTYGESVTNLAHYSYPGDSGSVQATFTVAAEIVPPLPGISIDDVTVVEGDGNSAAVGGVNVTNAIFRVTLSTSSSVTATVAYATADGTATTVDNDYVATAGTLTFAPGATEQTIAVGVNGDTAVEPDETFAVNLSNALDGLIVDGQGLGAITNDDIATNPPPRLPPPKDDDDNDDDDDDDDRSPPPPPPAAPPSAPPVNEPLPVSALPETGFSPVSAWSGVVIILLGLGGLVAFALLYRRRQAHQRDR